MQYYNSQGELVELNGKKSGIYGWNSEIMREDDDSFYKRYFGTTHEYSRISIETFEFLKNIENDHLIKLHERFYEAKPFITAEDLLYNLEEYIIDVYTYDWVDEDSIDILSMPIDYLMDNLSELLDLGDYFAKYGMKILDAEPKNVVINKSNIVLIDPDFYCFCYNASYKCFPLYEGDLQNQIVKWNRTVIVSLFKALCSSQLKLRDYDPNNAIDSFFEDVSSDGNYDASIVSKKLMGYSTPNDYFMHYYK